MLSVLSINSRINQHIFPMWQLTHMHTHTRARRHTHTHTPYPSYSAILRSHTTGRHTQFCQMRFKPACEEKKKKAVIFRHRQLLVLTGGSCARAVSVGKASVWREPKPSSHTASTSPPFVRDDEMGWKTNNFNELERRSCDYRSDARRALLSNSQWAEDRDVGMSCMRVFETHCESETYFRHLKLFLVLFRYAYLNKANGMKDECWFFLVHIAWSWLQ